jgi:lysophospholipase L1-like esterase
MASKGSVVKITDPADEEEYSTNDLYADTVLFGDMIIEGIQDYGYLGTGNIVSDNNLTTDKAHNYISDVKDRTPSKIFLLVGLNDLNYGTRSGTDVAERIENLVAALKENIPSAKIYVVSLLPVTESFEAKSSVKIKQSDINDANKKLAEDATTMGAVFVDIADSFKDGSGYLNTKYSTGGYNLNHNYYPFFLNKLAGAAK